jgi:transposase
VLEVFDAAQSCQGEPGHDDRKFLDTLHFFTVHNVTWRALPADYGNWNSVCKRFWRLSRSGVFEAFLQLLTGMFDNTVGASACFGWRRKRGQENQALGRSRGGAGFGKCEHLLGKPQDAHEG